MSRNVEVTYAVDFRVGRSSDRLSSDVQAGVSIPRIARLMALAIRFEGLVRKGTIRDYADLARRGHVTRARMTQIMKLLDLAPDIQEQILFLPPINGLNERNLRRIVSRIDWHELIKSSAPGLRTRHLAGPPALARFEFGSLAAKKANSVRPRLLRKIIDLEHHHAGNQAFFNAFSKVIKCVFRVDLADGIGAITEPQSSR